MLFFSPILMCITLFYFIWKTYHKRNILPALPLLHISYKYGPVTNCTALIHQTNKTQTLLTTSFIPHICILSYLLSIPSSNRYFTHPMYPSTSTIHLRQFNNICSTPYIYTVTKIHTSTLIFLIANKRQVNWCRKTMLPQCMAIYCILLLKNHAIFQPLGSLYRHRGKLQHQ
jgi:hypothetical protein